MNFQREMEWSGVKVLRDDFKEWRSCTRKRPYSTFSAAEQVLKRMPVDGRKLHVYFCENCYRFHVGHVSQEKQK